MMRLVVVASLVTALASCGDVQSVDLSKAEFKNQPIFGGSPPNDPRYDAVAGMYITVKNSVYICSGTLIAPDVVVSAGHCFVHRTGRKTSVSKPGDVQVFFGDQLGGPSYSVSELMVHPGYSPTEYGVNDVTLLRLSSTGPAAPIEWLPAGMSSLEVVGTPVIFAGYGQTETGGIGTKLWVDGAISEVTATALRNEQDDETGTCGGDSGGPLIYDFNGTWYVGGTTSWGDSACTDYGYSMRVSAYDNWIADFVDDVPVPDCTVDADCADGDDCTIDTCSAGTCIHQPDPTCTCAPKKAACSVASDCCSGRCVKSICR